MTHKVVQSSISVADEVVEHDELLELLPEAGHHVFGPLERLAALATHASRHSAPILAAPAPAILIVRGGVVFLSFSSPAQATEWREERNAFPAPR